MKLMPSEGHYVTISIRTATGKGNRNINVIISNDGSSTTVRITYPNEMIFYLKADKVAKGASITADSTYADSWASGGNQETYSGPEGKWVNVSFDQEVNLRWTVVKDGYLSDAQNWVGDPSTWESYDEAVAACKQAWLDYLNSLPLQLDEFNWNFYKGFTQWLGNWLDATDIRVNGYKPLGYVPADTPFPYLIDAASTWLHEFDSSLWGHGFVSCYLCGLLDKNWLKNFISGMIELSRYLNRAASFQNI